MTACLSHGIPRFVSSPWLLVGALLLVGSGQTALAQTVTASVSGTVVSPAGYPLRAIVALIPSGGGAVRQAFTDFGGVFNFNQLSAGQYTLCERIPAEQSPSPDRPYLDTCMWPQPQIPVQVSAGQTLASIQVVAPQGVALNVQVNDPQGLLAQTTPQQSAQAPDAQLQVLVRQTNLLPYRLPLISQTATARNYSLVVPAAASLLLTVKSPQASVLSQTGALVQGETNLSTPSGSALSPLQFTIQH